MAKLKKIYLAPIIGLTKKGKYYTNPALDNHIYYSAPVKKIELLVSRSGINTASELITGKKYRILSMYHNSYDHYGSKTVNKGMYVLFDNVYFKVYNNPIELKEKLESYIQLHHDVDAWRDELDAFDCEYERLCVEDNINNLRRLAEESQSASDVNKLIRSINNKR